MLYVRYEVTNSFDALQKHILYMNVIAHAMTYRYNIVGL